MRNIGKIILVLCASILFASIPLYAQNDDAAKEQKRQQILKDIDALRKKKQDVQNQTIVKLQKTKPQAEDLKDAIDQYYRVLAGCSAAKSLRCADAMFSLAPLLYNQARDGYNKSREQYEKDIAIWEKTSVGSQPINPTPDYSAALGMYRQLIELYPDYVRVADACFQMGTIYNYAGNIDSAKYSFNLVVQKAPNGPRASESYFRLANYLFSIDRDYSNGLKMLDKVREDLDPALYEQVHYLKAEGNYYVGNFDKAIELFFSYVEKCDGGQYPAKLRKEALEYLAITFADMPRGADMAINFFKKVGKRPYQDFVLYTVGMKNRAHDQTDDAIMALETALKTYPYYKDAPVAQQMLIECYMLKKKVEDANVSRERLVDMYWSNGEWAAKNAGNFSAIENAKAQVRIALSSIPLYYHDKAEKSKDKNLYQKALGRYLEFFQKFPDDKWITYEFKYYVGEIYFTLADYENAATNYDYVASVDLSTYGMYSRQIDTVGLDPEQVQKIKKERSTTAISQEDAGYNAVVAYDKARIKAIAKKGLSDEQGYGLSETKRFLDYCRVFQKRFPKSPNASEVLGMAANVHYTAKSWANAISDLNVIVMTYPGTPLANKSIRLLAQCYVNTGEFDLAQKSYREMLAKMDRNTTEYDEVLNLAASVVFKRADNMRKDKNYTGAAEVFKTISVDFPTSKAGDRGWFEAGVCYEQATSFELAAQTFERLTVSYPQSTLREKAFLRAAENYKKGGLSGAAAKVYLTAALSTNKSDFAIMALSLAAKSYEEVKKFDSAGRCYETIYARYPTDSTTPAALYNAGYIYEKGKMYNDEIRVYRILVDKFENSEYAPDAFWAIGLCYENLKNETEMAAVFTQYAKKYATDRLRQLEAFVKAGDAYFKMKDWKTAYENYFLATDVYEKYDQKADMDAASVAKAYCKIGEIKYEDFKTVQLTGSEKEIKEKTKQKEKLLGEAAKLLGKAIGFGVEEWTTRATYLIARSFLDFAYAITDQTVHGSEDQKFAARIQILTSLDVYYRNALKYFYQNLEFARTQGVKNEYIDKSIEEYTHILFLRPYAIERAGLLYKNSPVPKNQSAEDKQAYRELLEESYLTALDKSKPLFEEGIRTAAGLGLGKSRWIDSTIAHLAVVDPSDSMLTKEIPFTVYANVGIVSKSVVAAKEGRSSSEKGAVASSGDNQYDRNIRRIQNIVSMDVSVSDRIKQINRIERDTKRAILAEEDRIAELKRNAQ